MKAVLITTNKFPLGDAGAVREEALAKCFLDNNIEFVVIGMGTAGNGSCGGIAFYSFRANKGSIASRIKDRITFYKKAVAIIEKEKPNVIVTSAIDGYTLRRTKKYASKRGITIIANCVEWYSADEFMLGNFSPFLKDIDRINGRIIDAGFKVISISSYLDDYFKGKGITSILIPAILDVESIPYSNKNSNKKRIFIYAGAPGKKDRLKEVIEALSLMEPFERKQIEFRIIGADLNQLKNESGIDVEIIDNVTDMIRIYGRLSRDEVVENLVDADFSFLFRDNEKRFAKAGFPTKFAESMASATPVICNISSDLDKYVLDGVNGFVCKDYYTKSILSSIKRAISLSSDELEKMKINARITAEKYFDYKKYSNYIKDLL